MTIHETAIVDSQATIADSATVGPYCIIKGDVSIGENTILENHVTIHGKTIIGKNNHLFPSAVIGVVPQDLKYTGEDTQVLIGDDNIIREHTSIHQGTQGGGGKTIIGNKNLIMAYVHVAHDCIIHDEVILANGIQLAGHCIIENYANIGGMTGLHHFTTIGAYAFIGGMSRINKDVPPFMMVEGNPARLFGPNLVGLRRRGFNDAEVSAVKKAARIMHKAQYNATASLERIESDKDLIANPKVQQLINALKATTQGENGRALEKAHAHN